MIKCFGISVRQSSLFFGARLAAEEKVFAQLQPPPWRHRLIIMKSKSTFYAQIRITNVFTAMFQTFKIFNWTIGKSATHPVITANETKTENEV